jgi:hypothetical protein
MLMGVAFLLRRKVKSERMYDHGRRLVLYGIAGILAFIQRCWAATS